MHWSPRPSPCLCFKGGDLELACPTRQPLATCCYLTLKGNNYCHTSRAQEHLWLVTTVLHSRRLEGSFCANSCHGAFHLLGLDCEQWGGGHSNVRILSHPQKRRDLPLLCSVTSQDAQCNLSASRWEAGYVLGGSIP